MKRPSLTTAIRVLAVLSLSSVVLLAAAYWYLWEKTTGKLELRNESGAPLAIEIRAGAAPIAVERLEPGESEVVRFQPEADATLDVSYRPLSGANSNMCTGRPYVTGSMGGLFVARFRPDGSCQVEEIFDRP